MKSCVKVHDGDVPSLIVGTYQRKIEQEGQDVVPPILETETKVSTGERRDTQ